MTPLIQTLTNISPHWWDYTFHASWQSALIGLLLLALVWLGRKWSAPLRYGILLLALIKFLIPPMLSLPTGVLHYTPAPETVNLTVQAPRQRPDLPSQPSFPINEKTNVDSHKPKNAENPPAADTKTASIQQIPKSSPSPAPSIISTTNEARSTLSLTSWLLLAHILGSFIFLLWLGIQVLRLQSIINQSRLATEGILHDRLHALIKKYRTGRPVTLRLTEQGIPPISYGLFKPAILLPSSLAQSEPGDIDAVLTHELAHIHRKDAWVVWLQMLVTWFWWFHPVLWLLNRELRNIREDCCDDFVLTQAAASNQGYCQTLLNTARRNTAKVPVAECLCIVERRHPLLRRLKRITDMTQHRAYKLSFFGFFLLLLFAFVVLPGMQDVLSETDFQKPFAINGRILGPDGESLGGVEITFKNPEFSHTAISAADGSFSINNIKTNMYFIHFKADRYTSPFHFQENAFPFRRVLLHPNMPELNFHLREGQTLAGVVQNEEKKPIAGAKLIVYREITPGGRFPQNKSIQNLTDVVSDANGRFAFNNLRPGKVMLEVTHPNYAPIHTGHLQVTSTTHEIVLPRGRAVSGKLLDPDNNPLPDHLVRCSTAKYAGRHVQYVTQTTNPQGEFQFKHMSELPLHLAAYNKNDVLLVHEPLPPGSANQTGLVLKAEPQTERPAPKASFHGRLVDQNFEPLSGVAIYGLGQSADHILCATTNGEGIFAFTIDEQQVSDEHFLIEGAPQEKQDRYVPYTHFTGLTLAGGKAKMHPKTHEKVYVPPIRKSLIQDKGEEIPTILIKTIPKNERYKSLPGKVVDYKNQPIKGITILAIRNGQTVDTKDKNAFCMAESNTQGNFVLDKIIRGHNYIIVAQGKHKNHFVQDSETYLQSMPDIPAADRITFKLSVPSTISGRLLTQDGQPVESFNMEVSSVKSLFSPLGPNHEFKKTQGEFTIHGVEPGQTTLEFASPQGQAAHTLFIEEGKDVENLTVKLQKGRSLRGTVNSATGPVKNATIEIAIPQGFHSQSMTKGLHQAMAEKKPVHTNEKGKFTIQGVPKFPIQVNITHDDFALQQEIVFPNQFDNELHIALTKGGTIQGTILQENGEPDAEGKVSFNLTDTIIRKTQADKNGRFTFAHVKPGTYLLRPPFDTMGGMYGMGMGMSMGGNQKSNQSLRFPSTACEVKEGETTTVTLQPGRADIHGQVRYKNQPVADATITIFNSGSQNQTHTNAKGNYRFHDVPAGNKELYVRAKLRDETGRTFSGGYVEDRKVKVPTSGEVRHDMAILDTHIHGQVTDQATGEPIPYCKIEAGRITNNSYGVQPVETDTQGRYHLDCIDYGRHALFVKDQNGYANTMKIVHLSKETTTKDINIELSPKFGAVKGKVMDKETGDPINMLSLRCIPADNINHYPEAHTLHRGIIYQGAYELTKIPEGRYYLLINAYYKGYALAVSEPFDIQNGETAEIDMTLSKGVPISIQFYSSGGERLDRGASNTFDVFLHLENGITMPISSSALVLNPGAYRVTASRAGRQKAKKHIKITKNSPARLINITVPSARE